MAYDNLSIGDKIRVLNDGVEPQNDGTYKDLLKSSFANNKILLENGVGYDAKYIGEDTFGLLFDVVDPSQNASTSNFELEVVKGNISGHSTVDKFGENPDIDSGSAPEDIWEVGGLYNYDATGTAPIVSIISDSAADTMEITIQGLDIDGNLVSQNVTLNGTTRVALTTPLWRVFRMFNTSSTDIDGMVRCYIGTGGFPSDADTRAEIDNGNNQTLMAIYTVPLGKVGFLYRGELGMSRSQSTGAVAAAYYSRRVGKVFRVKKRVDITNQGSSVYQDARSFPDIIPALTDIRLTVEEVSANNVGVFGTFDILLVDEDKFSQAYLDAIGQPSVMP